jgi:hypothetical protein
MKIHFKISFEMMVRCSSPQFACLSSSATLTADSNHSMLLLAKLIIGALDDSCLPLHDIMAEPWNKFQKISQAIFGCPGCRD